MMGDDGRQTILDSYLNRIEYVPTVPIVINQVLSELENPDVELDNVVEIIMADQVLTLRMIRLINSSFWGLRHQVQSLKEAIVYMGLREVRNVTLSTWLVNAFVSKVAGFRIEVLWEHSFGCALVSRLFAKTIGFRDPERAYLGGLLHDVGEVVLCQNFPDEFAEIVSLVQGESISFLEAEDKVMGINHTDFGPWLVGKWNLDESFAEVAGAHHDVSKAEKEPELVAIVNLADLFCRLRNMGCSSYERLQVNLEEERAWKILAANLPKLKEIDLERFTFDLDDRAEEVRAAVGNIYSTERVSVPEF